jgi:hypothetical protein
VSPPIRRRFAAALLRARIIFHICVRHVLKFLPYRGNYEMKVPPDLYPRMACFELFYRLFAAIKTGPYARDSLKTTVEWAFWLILHEAAAF